MSMMKGAYSEGGTPWIHCCPLVKPVLLYSGLIEYDWHVFQIVGLHRALIWIAKWMFFCQYVDDAAVCLPDLMSESSIYLWWVGHRHIIPDTVALTSATRLVTLNFPWLITDLWRIPPWQVCIQMAHKWLSNLTFGVAFCFISHFQTSHPCTAHRGGKRWHAEPATRHLEFSASHAQSYPGNHQNIDFYELAFCSTATSWYPVRSL